MCVICRSGLWVGSEFVTPTQLYILMNALVPAYSHIVEAGSMKLTTFDKIPISFAVSKIWISYISEDFMSSVRQMYYFSTQSILP